MYSMREFIRGGTREGCVVGEDEVGFFKQELFSWHRVARSHRHPP